MQKQISACLVRIEGGRGQQGILPRLEAVLKKLPTAAQNNTGKDKPTAIADAIKANVVALKQLKKDLVDQVDGELNVVAGKLTTLLEASYQHHLRADKSMAICETLLTDHMASTRSTGTALRHQRMPKQ